LKKDRQAHELKQKKKHPDMSAALKCP